MPVQVNSLLETLGYKVDKKGNVRVSDSQLAIVSLESTDEGGVLRIHGDPNSFFYYGEELLEDQSLCFPKRVSPRYVYFSSDVEEGFKVTHKEFITGMMKAMTEYQRFAKKEIGG
jgi:hypothetical protein